MKLTARQPIRHDGKRYAEGETLNVNDKTQAQSLIDCGSAELAGKASSDAKTSTEAAVEQAQA